jgi:glyoxylase-like metal-dependent hydrolase (beta-lactamase superfamily II)
MPDSNGAAASRMIGDIEVTTVSDGLLNATLMSFVGIEIAECERLSGLPAQGPVPLAVNAFLLKFGGKHAVVDTGSSSTMGPTLGELPNNLRAAGVPPEKIDYVLLTHIHPDHSNGLVDDNGRANFPNAEVIVHETEAKFWLDQVSEPGEPEMRQRNRVAAARAFAPYRGRVRRVADGEALPGISAVMQPGHTPGHTGWLVSSRGDSVLIWGDIVHAASVQMPRPDAALTFDTDPEMARKSRARVFDWVATDHLRVAGAHLDLPSFGYLTRAGTGFRFEPDV